MTEVGGRHRVPSGASALTGLVASSNNRDPTTNSTSAAATNQRWRPDGRPATTGCCGAAGSGLMHNPRSWRTVRHTNYRIRPVDAFLDKVPRSEATVFMTFWRTGTARTIDTARSQRPAAVNQPSTPKEPAQPQPETPASPEPATVELPQASRRQQPAASNGGEPAASESQSKHRRYRRDDDDFGDFTYLHDSEETDPRMNPGTPASRGRRAL
jgi:hypothetical protein